MVTHHTTGIVTVSYGSNDALTEFLTSLFKQHPSLPTSSVVVVDNKPDHENVAILAQDFGVEYLAQPSNPGYGAGMNAGVAYLQRNGNTYEQFFFCNPDVTFIEPVVEQLAHALKAGQSIGSIGPRLLNTDGTVYPSARNIPSLSTGIGHAILGRVWPANPFSRSYKNASDYERVRPAGSLSGAAVMTSAEAYRALKGWDEAYFMHFEDIDLGWRLTQLGYTNLFFPTVSVEHSGGHSTEAHAVIVERAMTNSAVRFMNKRYAGFWNAPIRWCVTLGLQARGKLRERSITRTLGG